jgi:putative FmdB family regulatory protein
MPTYQYECSACGHSFEQFQSMTDAKLKKCPECGKNKLNRLVGSGSGVIFKGSGFYETDYKNKSCPMAEKSTSAKDANTACSGGNCCSGCK